MKFSKTEVWGFEHAIRGARNPMNSWDKSDSYDSKKFISEADFYECQFYKIVGKNCVWKYYDKSDYIIGDNDMALLQRLIKAGPEHRKFMRQIMVSVDITAPQFWWSEFDTYKIGTVANSTSKMHKLASTPITIDCFETDDYCPSKINCNFINNELIPFLEDLRLKYLETKDIVYWKELIRWLPESWLQTRTVTMNYENLLGMCSPGQRRFHKLTEWSDSFISWARALPYAQELIFIDEVSDNGERN